MEESTTTQTLIRVTALALFGFAVWSLTSGMSGIRADIAQLRADIAHLEEEVHELRRPAAAGTVIDDHAAGAHAEPHAVVPETEHDFGRIRSEDGAVSTTFTIDNGGAGELMFGTITTSCGCTSASADTDTVVPGEEATVTVTFDPNVHEEPEDRFSRSVYIPTNDHDMPEIELVVFVDIIEND